MVCAYTPLINGMAGTKQQRPRDADRAEAERRLRHQPRFLTHTKLDAFLREYTITHDTLVSLMWAPEDISVALRLARLERECKYHQEPVPRPDA